MDRAFFFLRAADARPQSCRWGKRDQNVVIGDDERLLVLAVGLVGVSQRHRVPQAELPERPAGRRGDQLKVPIKVVALRQHLKLPICLRHGDPGALRDVRRSERMAIRLSGKLLDDVQHRVCRHGYHTS